MEKLFFSAVIVFMVGIFGLVGVRSCANISGMSASKAKHNAEKYAYELGMEKARVSCVDMDSDGDGYVSCTILNGDKMLAVECAGFGFNSGCKIQRNQFQTNQNVRNRNLFDDD